MNVAKTERQALSRRKKLVFLAVILLLFYIPAEIIHRVLAFRRYEVLCQDFFPSYEYDEGLSYVFVPGDFEGRAQGTEIDFFYHINEQGLRGPEIDESKRPGTVRVLCLGGSTTFGTGCLTDETSYPSQLERELRTRLEAGELVAAGIEVLNAGVPGYRSAESILQLERYRHLDPDVVIVCHGINDITWGDDTEFYRDPRNHPRPEDRLQRVWRRAHSTLVGTLWHRLISPRREKLKGAGSVNYPSARSAFEGNLATLAGMITSMGATPVFLTFESRLRAGLDEKTRAAIESDSSFSISFQHFDDMLSALTSYNDSVRRVAREKGVACIDLCGVVPADPELWSDFCHLTDAGTSVMVVKLAPPIAEIIACHGEENYSEGGR